MILITFTPADWFWIVAGDETKWWSSKASAYVAPVQAWLDAGDAPTRIASEAELQDVLVAYGLTGPLVDLKALAADKRWRVETGGIAVAGASIATGRDNQAMITGAVAYAQLNPEGSIDFKTDTGWVTLSAAQMVGIGEAVGAHVQACFAAEKGVDADIDAGAIATAAQVETDPRWP